MGGIEIMERTKEDASKVSISQYIINYVTSNKDLIDGIRNGMAARREGNVAPWREIKEKFRIG